jgi:hypothetical protein
MDELHASRLSREAAGVRVDQSDRREATHHGARSPRRDAVHDPGQCGRQGVCMFSEVTGRVGGVRMGAKARGVRGAHVEAGSNRRPAPQDATAMACPSCGARQPSKAGSVSSRCAPGCLHTVLHVITAGGKQDTTRPSGCSSGVIDIARHRSGWAAQAWPAHRAPAASRHAS